MSKLTTRKLREAIDRYTNSAYNAGQRHKNFDIGGKRLDIIMSLFEQHLVEATLNGEEAGYRSGHADAMRNAQKALNQQALEASQKSQIDSALHVEEYHYHKLNDVKIGNATIEQLLFESKERIKQLKRRA